MYYVCMTEFRIENDDTYYSLQNGPIRKNKNITMCM